MEQTKVRYRVSLLKVIPGQSDKVIHSFTRPCTQEKAEKIFQQLLSDWGLEYNSETGFNPPIADGMVYPGVIAVE